jgi:nucleoside-diphosphate-sugar epimerase
MRVFLTGSTGVIGRRAIPLLVAAGHRVTAVARTAEKRAAVERLGAAAVLVDLYDPNEVQQAVRGHDAVINLATHIPPATRAFLPGAWRENSRVRRLVSANLADAVMAQGRARIIQESFAPIYPDRGDEWIHEIAPTKPARYNRAVLDAEAAASRGVVLRFAYFYGPDSDFTRGLIASVRDGRAQLLGDPRGFWSVVSHDDAATAVVAALDVPPGIYNVVDDEPLTRRALVDNIAAVLGVPPPKLLPGWLKYLLGSLGETLSRSQRISNRKLKAVSGWAPRWRSAREGLAEVVQGRHTEGVGRFHGA